jgi:subtilisin family serine protease
MVTGYPFELNPPLWSQQLIGAPLVWEQLDVHGAGFIIGQSDSGVDGEHLELREQYRGNRPGGPAGDDYNWLDPWNTSTSPTDLGGHGTHTLGTALGRTVGIAPDATWIGCVNLARNLGNAPRYLDCLQFLLAPFPQGGDPFHDGRPELGAHVLNNSWGCPEIEGCDATALLPAARALRAAGVFVVASAGNSGSECGTISAPIALYDEVFTVGAIDEFGAIAPFSSRGPVTADGSGRIKPDIVAPGVNILSAYPGGGYAYNDGTSMAGPHVAGVVALMWSANPALIGDVDRTEQILIETAQPYNAEVLGVPQCGEAGTRPDNATGFGIVDAFAAVERALAELGQ